MELKDVRSGMFVAWRESNKNIVALVSNIFFDKENFEFACAAEIKLHEATEEEKNDSLYTLFMKETRLDALKMTHRSDEWPGFDSLFIMKNENFESVESKLKTLRYATFEEVNTLVQALGFGTFVYKPLIFKWDGRERSLVCMEDVTYLEEKPNGVACIDGVMFAVNTDTYLKDGVVKYI